MTVRVADLLAEYRSGASRPVEVERLRFGGVGDLDVYNVSGVFRDTAQGPELVAGRVEARDSERSEVVVFQRENDGGWLPRPGAARLSLQDPFAFVCRGTRYLGGVEIAEADGAGEGGLRWRTVIFDHTHLAAPEQVFVGPWGMKDLRLVELADGRVGVFTRPQGGADGRGRIGFTVVDTVETLTTAAVDVAPRFETLFDPEEWGGVNHCWLRSDGRIGILGHIACFDEAGTRHYLPMSFSLDPATRHHTAPRILFERADLPNGPAKRPDLVDVVFPGWVDTSASAPAVYCGVSDAEAYRVVVPAL